MVIAYVPDEHFFNEHHNERNEEEAEWEVEQEWRDMHLSAEFAGVTAQETGVTRLRWKIKTNAYQSFDCKINLTTSLWLNPN